MGFLMLFGAFLMVFSGNQLPVIVLSPAWMLVQVLILCELERCHVPVYDHLSQPIYVISFGVC